VLFKEPHAPELPSGGGWGRLRVSHRYDVAGILLAGCAAALVVSSTCSRGNVLSDVHSIIACAMLQHAVWPRVPWTC
jgi:hypothetical protein